MQLCGLGPAGWLAFKIGRGMTMTEFRRGGFKLVPRPEAFPAEVPGISSSVPSSWTRSQGLLVYAKSSHSSRSFQAEKLISASAFCLSASAWESATFHFFSASEDWLLLSFDFLASSVFFFEACTALYDLSFRSRSWLAFSHASAVHSGPVAALLAQHVPGTQMLETLHSFQSSL